MVRATLEVERRIGIKVEGLGRRIQAARKADGRSMRVLSDLAGITPTHWYDIEGERLVKLPEETLRGIERALGVDFGVTFPDS